MKFFNKILNKKIKSNNLNKILLTLFVFVIIISGITLVSAESSLKEIGSLKSSNFDLSWSISGAGNSFTINEDGSASPNAQSNVDNKYNYSIEIDISNLDDSTKSLLEEYQQKSDKKCELVLNDGNNNIHFKGISEEVNITLEGNTLKVSGHGSNSDNYSNFNFDNAEITACKLTSDNTDNFCTDNYSEN